MWVEGELYRRPIATSIVEAHGAYRTDLEATHQDGRSDGDTIEVVEVRIVGRALLEYLDTLEEVDPDVGECYRQDGQ